MRNSAAKLPCSVRYLETILRIIKIISHSRNASTNGEGKYDHVEVCTASGPV
jgi:hypothetical protein